MALIVFGSDFHVYVNLINLLKICFKSCFVFVVVVVAVVAFVAFRVVVLQNA